MTESQALTHGGFFLVLWYNGAEIGREKMKGATRKFLTENRLKIEEAKLVVSGSITFSVMDLQYIKFMLEHLSYPDNAWDPIDWDTVEEAYQDYWHKLHRRVRGNLSIGEAMEFRDGLFCVKDPANGPVDLRIRYGVVEFTPPVLDDLIHELDQTGPDGIPPVQGFKA
jgi:hypothetical protein